MLAVLVLVRDGQDALHVLLVKDLAQLRRVNGVLLWQHGSAGGRAGGRAARAS